jgi:hypothetical protein
MLGSGSKLQQNPVGGREQAPGARRSPSCDPSISTSNPKNRNLGATRQSKHEVEDYFAYFTDQFSHFLISVAERAQHAKSRLGMNVRGTPNPFNPSCIYSKALRCATKQTFISFPNSPLYSCYAYNAGLSKWGNFGHTQTRDHPLSRSPKLPRIQPELQVSLVQGSSLVTNAWRHQSNFSLAFRQITAWYVSSATAMTSEVLRVLALRQPRST